MTFWQILASFCALLVYIYNLVHKHDANATAVAFWVALAAIAFMGVSC